MSRYLIFHVAMLGFVPTPIVMSYQVNSRPICRATFIHISNNNQLQQDNVGPTTSRRRCIQSMHQMVQGSPIIWSRQRNERISQSCVRSMAVTENDFVEARDLEALQTLFNRYCDKEGLMTKKMVLNVPAISELIADDNVLPEELDAIWNRVPKFPEADSVERIDVDSWVQLYRDIDDLFEDETEQPEQLNIPLPTTNDKNGRASLQEDDDKTALQSAFSKLCSKGSGSITKKQLFEWSEVKELLGDGLLSLDELEDIWTKTSPKIGKKKKQIEFAGFVNFNAALDSLFDFEDDIETNALAEAVVEMDVTTPKPAFVPRMVQGEGLEPSILFAALADPDGYVGKEELQYWDELQDMLRDGDLLPTELNNIYAINVKNGIGKLDEEGFITLYESINELFVDDDEIEASEADNKQIEDTTPEMLKNELIEAIDDLASPDSLPCGLDADDRDKKIILSIVEELEMDPGNILRQRQQEIDSSDLAGDWELIYTSSSAMKFNKGLTGLGGSFPNGKFGSLTQKLRASKLMMDVEYIEHIQVTPATASFDVTVNGSWDLRSSISLFTGNPSVIMTVEPDRVSYGPTSTRADHWKSLGPMNMLDITYLDDDLRVMRGNTSIETIFVFRRIR